MPTRRRVALLAGVGENIGLATAKRWRASGFDLAITDVREPVLDDVRAQLEEIPGEGGLLALPGDATVQADVDGWVNGTVEAFGALDVAVALIGRSSFGNVLELPVEMYEQEVRTTLVGQFLIAQAAARAMVDAGNGGRIILLGSRSGEEARRGGVSHSVAKAGVVMLARAFALELGSHGITVNVVAPGLVPRPGHVSSGDYREAVRETLPLGRLGEPEDISGVIDFLAGPESAWMSGAVLNVDGGATAGNQSLTGHTSTPKSVF